MSINEPPFDGSTEDIHVFSGFVKPGRHVIIIYDPETKQFYHKDIVVEPRRSDLQIECQTHQKEVEKRDSLLSAQSMEDEFIFASHQSKSSDEFIRQLYSQDTKSR